jgi:hypothetical protein
MPSKTATNRLSQDGLRLLDDSRNDCATNVMQQSGVFVLQLIGSGIDQGETNCFTGQHFWIAG